MKNNETNWTVGTTWYKWFFTDGRKMVVLGMSVLLSILLNIQSEGLTLGSYIFIESLFSIGSLLVIITSIRDWRKEKSKLNKND